MGNTTSRITTALVAALALAGISDISVGNGVAHAAPSPLVFESASEGSTPFIGDITVSGIPQSATTFSFHIQPKPGTFSEPVTAVFTRQYLARNDYFTDSTTVTIPLFGLYDDYDNTVVIAVKSAKGRTTTLSHELTSSEWSSSCRDTLAGATKVVSPSTTVKLDYSFFMLKAWACGAHPHCDGH